MDKMDFVELLVLIKHLHSMKDAIDAIDAYYKADSGLKFASSALDRIVELIQNKDMDGMQELASTLPKSYRGLRRVYEAMERCNTDPELY